MHSCTYRAESVPTLALDGQALLYTCRAADMSGHCVHMPRRFTKYSRQAHMRCIITAMVATRPPQFGASCLKPRQDPLRMVLKIASDAASERVLCMWA